MKAVFCIAQNTDQAEIIVNDLITAGFSNNDISVLFPFFCFRASYGA